MKTFSTTYIVEYHNFRCWKNKSHQGCRDTHPSLLHYSHGPWMALFLWGGDKGGRYLLPTPLMTHLTRPPWQGLHVQPQWCTHKLVKWPGDDIKKLLLCCLWNIWHDGHVYDTCIHIYHNTHTVAIICIMVATFFLYKYGPNISLLFSSILLHTILLMLKFLLFFEFIPHH